MYTPSLQPQEPAAPPERRPRGRGILRILDRLVLALVLGGLAAAALGHLLKPARIYGLQAVGTPGDPRPAVWVTLKFDRVPRAGSAMDVQLIVNSTAFVRPISLDWRHIATHAQTMASNGLNRVPAPLPANQPPPLKRPIELMLQLPLKDRIPDVRHREGLPIVAELYWAGQKQGEARASANSLYIWSDGRPR